MLCRGAASLARPLVCAAHPQAQAVLLHSRSPLDGSTVWPATTCCHEPQYWALRTPTYQPRQWLTKWYSTGPQQGQERLPSRLQEVLGAAGRRTPPHTNTSIRSLTTGNTDSQGNPSTSLGKAGEAGEQEEEVDFKALVELEVELHRQEGFTVPSEITPFQWEELLTRKSVKGRKKYLTFLFKNEMRRENTKKKKEEEKMRREEEHRQRLENPPEDDGHIQYGLWRNSIFPKIVDSTMNHFYHTRVVQAMMFGQPLVLDLGFDDLMNSKERQNCAYQIQLLLSENRLHADPFSVELHNAPPTSDTMVRLNRYIPTMYQPEFPLVTSPESYLERYPREQLVYLTPHCRDDLITYDHDAVYIIGGIVDKTRPEPHTLAKAKKEGIRMQRFPLDRYLTWAMGGKSLTLNHTVNILLDMKHTGDWHYALRHVPSRKLRPPPTREELEVLMHKKIERQKRSQYFGVDRGHHNYDRKAYNHRSYKRY